jgi:hypothetical protein
MSKKSQTAPVHSFVVELEAAHGAEQWRLMQAGKEAGNKFQ